MPAHARPIPPLPQSKPPKSENSSAGNERIRNLTAAGYRENLRRPYTSSEKSLIKRVNARLKIHGAARCSDIFRVSEHAWDWFRKQCNEKPKDTFLFRKADGATIRRIAIALLPLYDCGLQSTAPVIYGDDGERWLLDCWCVPVNEHSENSCCFLHCWITALNSSRATSLNERRQWLRSAAE